MKNLEFGRTKAIFRAPDSSKPFGFTLIELLVVISIIGILATLVAANLNSARARARDTERKSDLKNISTGLRLYYNDKGTYPPQGYFDSIWGSQWAEGNMVYMNVLPNDPLPSQTYIYTYDLATDTFVLNACLENRSDDRCDKVGGSLVSCAGGATGCQYTVKP